MTRNKAVPYRHVGGTRAVPGQYVGDRPKPSSTFPVPGAMSRSPRASRRGSRLRLTAPSAGLSQT